MKIIDGNLIQNCPVTHTDIAAAETIFGTNLGALKGKTVYQLGIPVARCIEGIPLVIRE